MSTSRPTLGFEPVTLTAEERELMLEVRRFARAKPFEPSAASPTRGGFDRAFSEDLARHGWVGMTIPERYGGSARSSVERCLVISELLAAGAPLGAHWTADRQTAPSLLRNGPESLRRELLPRIAAGRCLMAGGFSEPDAGSDLASVRTQARKVPGGWLITGRKIWTTDADRADYFEILCRTSDAGGRKQTGLSLIIVPAGAPGLSVEPIEGMDGERHFNEVVIDEVFAPDDWLVGQEGTGWQQLTDELALERAGPERYLSTFPLLESFTESRHDVDAPEQSFELIGRVIAQQTGLRLMSLSIARTVDRGGSPVAEAAMAKDLGTELEQILVDELWRYRYEEIKPGPAADRFHEFLDINRLRSPVFTTAGGTNEVLRVLVGRQLPGWAAARKGWALRSPLAVTVFDQAEAIEAGRGGPSVPRGGADPWSARLLAALQASGFLGVSVAEELGGSGGSLNDALEVLRGAAYAGLSLPVIEGPVLAGWLLGRARIAFGWSDHLAVTAAGETQLDQAGGGCVLSGTLEAIAWPDNASMLVVPVHQDGQLLVATVPLDVLGLPPGGANTAGEPVARGVRLDRVPVAELAPTGLAYEAAAEALSRRRALARAVAMAAALQRTAELTIGYAGQRVQFGQPIARFQAVQTHLARLACEAQRVAVVVDAAQAALGEYEDPHLDLALAGAARTLAGEAAITGARVAHQVHGAIGVTMEYPLQRFTRRLWEWEAGDGTAARWARRLGAEAVTGPMRAWQLITGTHQESLVNPRK
jgi:alkylation response protein AidB-like acyl-CoA dehydrogenase